MVVLAALPWCSTACASHELRLQDGSGDASKPHGQDTRPTGERPESLRFQSDLCEGERLEPEYARIDENDLVRFLERQQLAVRVERPRADLSYVYLDSAGTKKPVRLRVAILPDSVQAGRELFAALVQHGKGSWGVHRSNLAVLGPVDQVSDDVAFATRTKLACWGVFTIQGSSDTFVVPGGYREL